MSQVATHYSVDPSLFSNNLSGSKSFGPLTVTYQIDLSVPQITASATLYGAPIGNIVLSPSHPSATLGGSVGIAKAELTLTVDFSKNQLDYDAVVEAFGSKIVDSSGVLFSW